MATIGILGGMGPQASNRLYELLITKTARLTKAAVDEDYPEIVLFSVPVPNFISDKSKLVQATTMLIERTKRLEQAGCSINGIACNTAHLLLPELQAVTNVPFVSLPKQVAQIISEQGYQRVGLLATPTTLGSRLYDDAVSSALLIRPDEKLASLTEATIYRKLANQLEAKEKVAYMRSVEDFMITMKLDAVILGCTELPLVFGETNDPRIIDTLDVLADALLGGSQPIYY
jgi:aspartate racemase